MPRSSRVLTAVILFTIAGFIAIGNVISDTTMDNWWLPIILFIIGLLLLLWPTADAAEAADYTESPVTPAAPTATAPEAIEATTPVVIPTTPEPSLVQALHPAQESDEVVLTSRPIDSPVSVEPTMNTVASRSTVQDRDVESPAEAEAVEAPQDSQMVREPLDDADHVEKPEPAPEDRSEATETNQNVNTGVTAKAVDEKPVEKTPSEAISATVSDVEGSTAEPAEDEAAAIDEREPMTEERSDAIAATVTAEDAIETGDTMENINIDEGVTLEETGEVAGPPGDSILREQPSMPDDLKVVEGIGKKMSAALIAAGIDTFEKLSNASEDEIRAAIAAAGMRFAPSVPTWAKQAEYAARGDWEGLKAYQDTLTAGRKE